MPLSHRKLAHRSPAAVLLLLLSILIARLAMGAGTVNAQTASPTPAPGPSPQVAEVTRPAPAPAPSPKVVAIDGHLELDTIVGRESFRSRLADHISKRESGVAGFAPNAFVRRFCEVAPTTYIGSGEREFNACRHTEFIEERNRR
jgi:hypothetical protein